MSQSILPPVAVDYPSSDGKPLAENVGEPGTYLRRHRRPLLQRRREGHLPAGSDLSDSTGAIAGILPVEATKR